MYQNGLESKSSLPNFPRISESPIQYAVWFTAAFLFAICEKRTKGLRIRDYEIRAEIESKVSLLRETRFCENVAELKILCEKLPVAVNQN